MHFEPLIPDMTISIWFSQNVDGPGGPKFLKWRKFWKFILKNLDFGFGVSINGSQSHWKQSASPDTKSCDEIRVVGRPPKVAKRTLCLPIEKGGLKAPDLTLMNRANRVAWIGRLIRLSEATFVQVLEDRIRAPVGQMVKMNYDVHWIDSRPIPEFYKEMLMWYKELNLIEEPSNVKGIRQYKNATLVFMQQRQNVPRRWRHCCSRRSWVQQWLTEVEHSDLLYENQCSILFVIW